MNLLRTVILCSMFSPILGEDYILISFSEEPVLTLEAFKNRLERLEDGFPEYKSVMSVIPSEEEMDVYERLLEAVMIELLSKKYVHEKGLDTNQKFQDDLRDACAEENHENFESKLYLRTFEESLLQERGASIDLMTDEDLRSYYENHREENCLFWNNRFSSTGPDNEVCGFKPFEEVRDEVRQVIELLELRAFAKNKIEELKQKYHVKVNKTCLLNLWVL